MGCFWSCKTLSQICSGKGDRQFCRCKVYFVAAVQIPLFSQRQHFEATISVELWYDREWYLSRQVQFCFDFLPAPTPHPHPSLSLSFSFSLTLYLCLFVCVCVCVLLLWWWWFSGLFSFSFSFFSLSLDGGGGGRRVLPGFSGLGRVFAYCLSLWRWLADKLLLRVITSFDIVNQSLNFRCWLVLRERYETNLSFVSQPSWIWYHDVPSFFLFLFSSVLFLLFCLCVWLPVCVRPPPPPPFLPTPSPKAPFSTFLHPYPQLAPTSPLQTQSFATYRDGLCTVFLTPVQDESRTTGVR